jgi:glycine dehydrogenase subunit 1
MPYILNTDRDTKEMLKEVGVESPEDLFVHLPYKVRLNEPLNLPCGYSELEIKKNIEKIASKNMSLNRFNSFLGAGCYDHYIPSALKFIVCRSEFSTAYTPYQAECSQGILQAIYEYQSYICILTGMDVSNASLFDGASALAEAVLMALRITKRKKIIISAAIHPEYKKVLRTYLGGFDFSIQEINFQENGVINIDNLEKAINGDTACLAFQSPNFFGLIEEGKKIYETVKNKGLILIVVTNPLSLAIFKEPSSYGVDIVCGEGQVLGGNLSLGGSTFGFLAAKRDYLRQMPGRIVGKTLDRDGNSSYCLTLQAREQHIRREKATSNICSNQSLNAIGAAVYLSLMGKEEFRKVALYSFNLAHYLYSRLEEIEEIKLPFGSAFFNEFVWEVEGARDVIERLFKKNIIAGLYIGDYYPQLKRGILSCCTEKKSKEDIDSFVEELKEILRKERR